MDKDSFMKGVLILIIVVCLWCVIDFFTKQKENMDGVDIMDLLYSNNKPIPQEAPEKPVFYYKNKNNKKQYQLRNKWDVEYTAGANNKCGDNLWHYTSPSKILIDNGLDCGKFNDANEPLGIESDLASKHDGTIKDGVVVSDTLLYDDFLPPELATGFKFGTCMNSGVVLPNQGCLQSKIYE